MNTDDNAWLSMDSAPRDGTPFLATREVPTLVLNDGEDEEYGRIEIVRDVCVAQYFFHCCYSIPSHAAPKGEKLISWQHLPKADTKSYNEY